MVDDAASKSSLLCGRQRANRRARFEKLRWSVSIGVTLRASAASEVIFGQCRQPGDKEESISHGSTTITVT